MVNLRAKEAERAAQMFRRQKAEMFEGSDDMFFDAKEYHSSNKNVANILSASESKQEEVIEPVAEATLDGVEDAWGDEEDGIDIDMGEDDLTADTGAQGATGDPLLDNMDSDIFVPPAAGADPLKQALKKNSHSVGLHVAAGEFTKALELLKKHLGINTYSSLKQAFIDIHTLSKMKLTTLPHVSPLDHRLRFVDQPLVAISLTTLQKMFSKGIECFTKGDFNGSILAFRNCLQFVPLIVVSSEKEMATVTSLTKRLVEYITANRIELERRRLVAEKSDDTNRITELSCYMTLCGMDNAHKFLVYKNAMNTNYKI
jgi:hypothetical protein